MSGQGHGETASKLATVSRDETGSGETQPSQLRVSEEKVTALPGETDTFLSRLDDLSE